MAGAGLHQLYFGDTTGKTFCLDEDVYSDDGSNIEVKVRTKEYYLSGPDAQDEIQRIFLYADDPQMARISISVDSGDYEALGSVTEHREPQKFDIWKKCFHFSIGIDEVSTNNIKIKGFNVHYEPQKEIR
jgi:hypothetical protein